MQHYDISCVVAINHFGTNSDTEISMLQKIVATTGHKAVLCKHWKQGGKGVIELAQEFIILIEEKMPILKFCIKMIFLSFRKLIVL